MELTWQRDDWEARSTFILRTAAPLGFLNMAVVLFLSARPWATGTLIGAFVANVAVWTYLPRSQPVSVSVSALNIAIFIAMGFVSGRDAPTWLLFLPPLVPILFVVEDSRAKLALVACDNLAATAVNLASGKDTTTTLAVAVALFVVTVLLFRTFQFLRMQSDIIEREREKSERLLGNILPDAIAAELKAHNAVRPVRFESASVLFTDFKGFTKIAEGLSPEELVGELDRCFSYFDSLMERHNLEKLKTIGDSFMCAGGIPVANRTHAIDCVLAAIEIQAFMHQMKAVKEQQGLPYWELRLGIHSGPLVAGVIGEKKFAYDIWGDTVNTASRAESSGSEGRINISAPTFTLVRDFFACDQRGSVSAKNKAPMEMYFVNGILPELSRDGDGRVPNERFRLLYAGLGGPGT